MNGVLLAAIVVGAMALIGALAIRYGVDTTEGSEDPRQPSGLTSALFR